LSPIKEWAAKIPIPPISLMTPNTSQNMFIFFHLSSSDGIGMLRHE
jgi:hypothetical protein